MDVEKALISKVIHLGDFITVSEEQISSKFFHGENRKIFRYITKYVEMYGEVPSPVTMRVKFPDYRMYKEEAVADPIKFYCDEVREKKKHNELVMGIQGAMNLMKKSVEGDVSVDQVLEHVTDVMHEVEGEFTKQETETSINKKSERLAEYKELSKSMGMKGLPIGFDRFDRDTGGLEGGDLMAVIAYTSVGKSWFKVIVSSFLEKMGLKVLFLTMEMSPKRILTRYEAVTNKLNYTRFSKGMLKPSELKKYEEYLSKQEKKTEEDGVFIAETVHGGLTEVSAKINKHKPDIVMIDGAYMLEDSEGDDDWRALVRIFRGLKRMATSFDIPIIASTQSKTRETTLESIAFAKHIRADVDVMIGLEQTLEMRIDKEVAIVPLKYREAEMSGKIYHNWCFNTMDWSSIYTENSDGSRPEGDISEDEVHERDIKEDPSIMEVV